MSYSNRLDWNELYVGLKKYLEKRGWNIKVVTGNNGEYKDFCYAAVNDSIKEIVLCYDKKWRSDKKYRIFVLSLVHELGHIINFRYYDFDSELGTRASSYICNLYEEVCAWEEGIRCCFENIEEFRKLGKREREKFFMHYKLFSNECLRTYIRECYMKLF